jgi:hypothetical protein
MCLAFNMGGQPAGVGSRGKPRIRAAQIARSGARSVRSPIAVARALGARPAWFRRGDRRGITRGEGRPPKEVRRARQ